MANGQGLLVAGKPGGSVRQRRVSAELRALRKARGLTCEEVATALGCSIAKISRMETGIRGLYPDDVAAVLGYLQAPAKLREELLALVRDGHKPNWIQVGGKLPTAWKELIKFEDQAIALYNYEPLVIPGLLQTGDYAAAVIRAGNRELTESEVDQMVRARMGRQAVLSRFGGPTLAAIVDEMVLRRPVGELGVMDGQLQHLLNMAKKPRIDLRVVPFKIGANPGLEGPVMILDFADQPTLVHIEVRGATGLLEEVPVVRSAKLAWRELQSMALPPEDSARLIADIAGELP
jgi:transcriptional regulator with XRE-family HTH domain